MSEVDPKVRCQIQALEVGEPAASFSKNTGIARGPKTGVALKQPLGSNMNDLELSR